MRRVADKLQQLIEDVVTAMDYELVGIEYSPRDKNALLRVYIDSEKGILIDDCSAVSHQLSGVFDVEDPISGNYDLEVSSPGLDRPIFKDGDFDRFAGNIVKIKLSRALDGRKNFKGLLQGIDSGDVIVNVDDEDVRLPLSNIDQAKLVPEF